MARRAHDVAILRRVGGRMRLFSIGIAFMLGAVLALNLTLFLASRIAAIYIAFIEASIAGSYVGLMSFIASIASFTVSYVFFTLKYKDVNEPLTREARVVFLRRTRSSTS
jgi:uncharacterized BrkB/YihY/UPF0761 family membrane protein